MAEKDLNLRAAISIFGVFFACCLDVLTLEYATRYDPGSGNLITFLQFFAIAFHGLIFTSRFFTRSPVIPMRAYLLLVTMFFVSSVLNNYALNFNISVPLLMIFRSASLMANMLLGIVILGKSYDLLKYVSVILITAGVFICTVATGSGVKSSSGGVAGKIDGAAESDNSFLWWLCGVGMLSLALFTQARMGLYQEVMYRTHGKHPQEALFYTHVLPLPAFLLMGSNIVAHARIAIESNSTALPLIGVAIQSQVLHLVVNFVAHYVCVKCVFILTSECTSLTVTMVITLRKFASLIFSIFYFKHAFTFNHWLGTVLIVVGTVMFTEMVPRVKELLVGGDNSLKNEEEEEKAKLLKGEEESSSSENDDIYKK